MSARWGRAAAGAAVVGTVALVAVLASSAGEDGTQVVASAQSPEPVSGRTITVSGHGVVTAAPDVATVWLGVSVDDDDAEGALGRASERAGELIDVLHGLGVVDDDIATSGVSLSPTYDYDDDPARIVGYQATNDLTVTIRDLPSAGRILDAAADAVGDPVRIGGISFSFDDTAASLAEARAAAMADAAARASQYATAGGAGVGAIVQISEQEVTPPLPWYAANAVDDSASARAGVPVPIQPGTQDLAVDVTVVYEITG